MSTISLKKIWQNVCINFSFDVRSIALFRIAIALTILYDCISYLYWSEAFLDPNGLFPINSTSKWDILENIFYFSNSLLWQQSIFLIGIFCSVCLLFGFKSRINSILLLCITLAIEKRFALLGGTVSIRMALLFALFLPLDAKWSLYKEKIKNKNVLILSGGTIAFTIKILIFYIAAAAFKTHPVWTKDFTAIYKTLWYGGISHPFGEWLRMQPLLTICLTFIVRHAEWLIAVGLIFPYKREYIRTLSALALIGLNVGFELSMGLEPYTYGNIAIATIFLPTEFWQWTVRSKAHIYAPHWQWHWHYCLPLFIVFVLFWKNLWHFNIVPKPPKLLYSGLEYMHYTEKWNMFSGSDSYFRFWPLTKGIALDGTILDPWKWYLNQDAEYIQVIPGNKVSELTPNNKWDKFITAIISRGTGLEYYQKKYLDFICRQYNSEHQMPLSTISLQWGYQEVKDFTIFGEIIVKDLYIQKCPKL